MVLAFLSGVVVLSLIIFFMGIRVVSTTERGVIETFTKYTSDADVGFNWVIPFIQRLVIVNVTERMSEIGSQEVITEDNLNAKVDMVIFYKVKKDSQSVCKAIYEVEDFESQITTLAQTTARNVIGTMKFAEVNSMRNKLNIDLAKILKVETLNWGVDIVRVELRDINPPSDVQETMNKVIKAQNEKRASVDFATAFETEADGKKRASIKEAEGIAQGKIIVADAEAKKIKVINEATRKYFTGNAQKFKQMEVLQESLKTNSKVILTEKGIRPNLLLGDLIQSK